MIFWEGCLLKNLTNCLVRMWLFACERIALSSQNVEKNSSCKKSYQTSGKGMFGVRANTPVSRKLVFLIVSQ